MVLSNLQQKVIFLEKGNSLGSNVFSNIYTFKVENSGKVTSLL